MRCVHSPLMAAAETHNRERTGLLHNIQIHCDVWHACVIACVVRAYHVTGSRCRAKDRRPLTLPCSDLSLPNIAPNIVPLINQPSSNVKRFGIIVHSKQSLFAINVTSNIKLLQYNERYHKENDNIEFRQQVKIQRISPAFQTLKTSQMFAAWPGLAERGSSGAFTRRPSGTFGARGLSGGESGRWWAGELRTTECEGAGRQ